MKKLLILIIILVYSCGNNNEVIDNNLKVIIENYISEYPLVKLPENYKQIGMSYPSYHIYFENNNNDTILNIFLSPNFDNFLEKRIIDQNETIFNSVNSDGFIVYKKKYPLIFFNIKYYNEYYSKYFIKEIPDSLKYRGGAIVHNKSKIFRYRLKNNLFEKIE